MTKFLLVSDIVLSTILLIITRVLRIVNVVFYLKFGHCLEYRILIQAADQHCRSLFVELATLHLLPTIRGSFGKN